MKTVRHLLLSAAFLIALGGIAWGQSPNTTPTSQVITNPRTIGTDVDPVLAGPTISSIPAAHSMTVASMRELREEVLALVPTMDKVSKEPRIMTMNFAVNAFCSPPDSSFTLIGFPGNGNKALTDITGKNDDPGIKSAIAYAESHGYVVATTHEVSDLNKRFGNNFSTLLNKARPASGNEKLDVIIVRVSKSPAIASMAPPRTGPINMTSNVPTISLLPAPTTNSRAVFAVPVNTGQPMTFNLNLAFIHPAGG